MTDTGKVFLLRTIGLIFFILPPVVATLNYFPLISGEPKKQLSFAGVFLILIACIPLWKFVKRLLKSPSALKIWIVLFLLFFVGEAISHEIKCIALVGIVGSLIGDGFFLWAKHVTKKKMLEPEE